MRKIQAILRQLNNFYVCYYFRNTQSPDLAEITSLRQEKSGSGCHQAESGKCD
jgi:hypothetical protein